MYAATLLPSRGTHRKIVNLLRKSPSFAARNYIGAMFNLELECELDDLALTIPGSTAIVGATTATPPPPEPLLLPLPKNSAKRRKLGIACEYCASLNNLGGDGEPIC